MYTLFFDTDCDVTPELAKHYGAKLISMPYSMDGEKMIFPYIDFDKYDSKAFFDELRKGTLPTTAALSAPEYLKYFEPEVAKGNDILYIHFSRAMSASFNGAEVCINELKEKYPDRRIVLCDTKFICTGSLNLCYQAGQMYLEGKSLDEIKDYIEDVRMKTGFYFFADNLKFFARSGRVTGIAATMGKLIGIKPIIHINDEGRMVSIDKAISRKKAIEKILQYMSDLADDIKSYPITIAHGDAMYLVDEFIAQLKAKFGEGLDIRVNDIDPTIGAHCGPDVLGVCFHAKHR